MTDANIFVLLFYVLNMFVNKTIHTCCQDSDVQDQDRDLEFEDQHS